MHLRSYQKNTEKQGIFRKKKFPQYFLKILKNKEFLSNDEIIVFIINNVEIICKDKGSDFF